MSINLTDLPLEAVGEVQIDFDNYRDATEFAPPAPEGTYHLKTTKIEIEGFANGIVTFLADHELYDIQTGGKVGDLRFDRFSTKVFQRNNVKASMAIDFLRAAGIMQPVNAPREVAELVLSVKSWCDQGNFWSAFVKWDGYCGHKDTQFASEYDKATRKLISGKEAYAPRGMKKWPQEGLDPQGKAIYNHVMPCPVCGNDVVARVKVDRRIPKVG